MLYCGRFSAEKNVPLLVEWMTDFQRLHPGKLAMVFAGQGQTPIPAEPWCRNLGFLGEEAKADLMAGARCVVNLSVNESLSLVALEAWVNGTPLLAHAQCPVLVDLLAASGGARPLRHDEHGALSICSISLTSWRAWDCRRRPTWRNAMDPGALTPKPPRHDPFAGRSIGS